MVLGRFPSKMRWFKRDQGLPVSKKVEGAIVLLLAVVLDGSTQPRGAGHWKEASLPMDYQRLQLDTGDLVFRTGRDVMARLVLSQGEEARFSHVGMLVRRGGDLLVIHAVPDELGAVGGVRMEPLVGFASPEVARDLGFYRLRGLTPAFREAMVAFLTRQIGKPFDARFQMSTDDSFYCTELVLKAITHAGCAPMDGLKGVRLPLMAEKVFPPDQLSKVDLLEPVPPTQ